MHGTILGYVDPTAGSILLQLVLGTLVGVVLYLRNGIARVFRRSKHSEKPAYSDNA